MGLNYQGSDRASGFFAEPCLGVGIHVGGFRMNDRVLLVNKEKFLPELATCLRQCPTGSLALPWIGLGQDWVMDHDDLGVLEAKFVDGIMQFARKREQAGSEVGGFVVFSGSLALKFSFGNASRAAGLGGARGVFANKIAI